ncbi:MAG: bidirectional hydrogenase complex protein HoxU [Egibacteraceae bacterium]
MARPRAQPDAAVTIDGAPVRVFSGESLLAAANRAGIPIPTLCAVQGLSVWGGCRVCVVEVAGDHTLRPACATTAVDGMEVTTGSDRLVEHRRQIVELLFAEGNHVCAVCVSNGACELQDLAVDLGVDHIRFAYQHPDRGVDLSHPRYGLDHNRCILCSRCVRTCAEIEGANVWAIAARGAGSRLVAELDEPWGESTSCTSCGKCVAVCPTGALFDKGTGVGEMRHDRDVIGFLAAAREQGEWHDREQQP